MRDASQNSKAHKQTWVIGVPKDSMHDIHLTHTVNSQSPSQKPKKYVKHAGDDDEEEEEEKEEEDGFEAAAKFTLDDLNDSGQPEMAKRDQMTMRLPSNLSPLLLTNPPSAPPPPPPR